MYPENYTQTYRVKTLSNPLAGTESELNRLPSDYKSDALPNELPMYAQQ